MPTVYYSGRLGRGCLPKGDVCLQGCLLTGVSTKGCVCLGECLPRGWPGCVCLRGLCPGECLPIGVSTQGDVCLGAGGVCLGEMFAQGKRDVCLGWDVCPTPVERKTLMKKCTFPQLPCWQNDGCNNTYIFFVGTIHIDFILSTCTCGALDIC